MTHTPILVLSQNDNVGVAIDALKVGLNIPWQSSLIQVQQTIKPGHKVALCNIYKGQPVVKYGQWIGFASENIKAGEHVHVHNLSPDSFDREYAFATEKPKPLPAPLVRRYFQGYDRGDGRFGTRNYVAIISTVNCSASVSKYISERIKASQLLRQYPNIDGVVAITHKAGCAMQYGGEDHQQLDRTLAGFARHPNVAAYLLIGLGCETGNTVHLIEGEKLLQLDGTNQGPIVLNIQDCGNISKTVEAGVAAVASILPRVNDSQRTTIGADKIVLGTNCGGSDGNSGITANPALGYASDLIIQQGGTSILAETPEIYGAEHLLTKRAISREVGQKLVEKIRWLEKYTDRFGVSLNNNPSTGNKEGGLSTIYEKSLGAIAKAGSTALVDVVRYAEPVTSKGLVFMDTPGYDPVSMTGIVAGGANVLVFTTGRGSVFGCKPTPSIKVATNTAIYQHMLDDMDIDAGIILRGESVELVGQLIFEEILAVASGKMTKSEIAGCW
ncbi:MAG TPA: altronate dehydratase family protein [Gemmatales bacterium]|nr:altronate dehydratase family protein [Gemmatales bacterium]